MVYFTLEWSWPCNLTVSLRLKTQSSQNPDEGTLIQSNFTLSVKIFRLDFNTNFGLQLESPEEDTPSRTLRPFIKKDNAYIQGLWSQKLIYLLTKNKLEIHSANFSVIQVKDKTFQFLYLLCVLSFKLILSPFFRVTQYWA